MEIIVGSKNEPKRQAVERAFSKVFPNQTLQIQTVETDSGVSSHPLSGSESLQGALNRMEQAYLSRPEADYFAGIEGGLLEVDGRARELGWVAIKNNIGQTHIGLSAGIELSGKLLEAVKNGHELSRVLHENHGLKDVGKANGFYGLTTDDLITRVDAYADAVVFALAPFLKQDYFN